MIFGDSGNQQELSEGAKYIESLRSELYNEETYKRVFPEGMETKYFNNFNLFDRDSDSFVTYDELLEVLYSIDQVVAEEDLRFLFEALDKDGRGVVSAEDFKIIVYKKFRDDDKKAELINAFRLIDKEDTGLVESDAFKELIMTMGNRYTEEKADEFLKEFDPKGEGKFPWKDVIDTVYVDETKKKKKKKGKGKKKKK